MSELALTILPETADDALAIERLHERTFGPGRYARSAYRIREGRGHVLELSFTARIGTLLVGSVRLTPICIGETPALLLGPLTVEPPFRARGVGSRADRARAEGRQGRGAHIGGAGRRRAVLRQVRLQAHPERPGEDAGSGRSGALAGGGTQSRRLRGCQGMIGRIGKKFSGLLAPTWRRASRSAATARSARRRSAARRCRAPRSRRASSGRSSPRP